VTCAAFVKYLEDYAQRFELHLLIRHGVKVIHVTRGSSPYLVTLQTQNAESPIQEAYDAVAVCSGVHNIPRAPIFEGQKDFRGQILHSSKYKDPEIFRGQRVLVIGTGATGFDVAHQAATHGAASVPLSTRHGFVSVPAHLGEDRPPLDSMIMNWGNHYWESKWAARVGLHWWIKTKFIRLAFLLFTGTTYGFNQWVGKRYNMTWDEGRKHIVNKSAKCMPLLSRKAKKEAAWWRRQLWSYWDPPDSFGQDIDLIEGSVSRLEDKTVHYEITREGSQGRTVEADIIVLATGYRQRFPFLFPGSDEKVEVEHVPECGDDPLPTEHFIVNT